MVRDRLWNEIDVYLVKIKIVEKCMESLTNELNVLGPKSSKKKDSKYINME